MAEKIRVLILEDRAADAKLIVRELERAGYDPTWERVDTEAGYLARLRPDLDLVIADGLLPQADTLRVLDLTRELGPDVPVIVVTGSLADERAVEYMKHGATDYLLKDRLARLGQAVTQALEKKRLAGERRRIEEERDRFFTLSRDLLCIAGFDGFFKRLNPAWETTSAGPPRKLLARPLPRPRPPDDRAAAAAAADRLAAGTEDVPAVREPLPLPRCSFRWLECGTRPPTRPGCSFTRPSATSPKEAGRGGTAGARRAVPAWSRRASNDAGLGRGT